KAGGLARRGGPVGRGPAACAAATAARSAAQRRERGRDRLRRRSPCLRSGAARAQDRLEALRPRALRAGHPQATLLAARALRRERVGGAVFAERRPRRSLPVPSGPRPASGVAPESGRECHDLAFLATAMIDNPTAALRVLG